MPANTDTAPGHDTPHSPQAGGGRHAYLILAHGQFKLLEYLLTLLDDPRNDIYLHIDAKVKNPPCAQLEQAVKHSRLRYSTTRYKVGWASPELSLAEMSLYETAASAGVSYSYYHLISGDSLPIKSQDFIHQYLASPENAGKNYLLRLPRASEADYDRLSKYHFRLMRVGLLPRLLGAWRLHRYSMKLQHLLGIDRIKGRFPIFCRGEQWCSLTAAAVHHLLAHRQEIHKLLKHSLVSDEVYKQLFLYNAAEFSGSMQQAPSLLFTDWSQESNHPRTFTAEHYELLTSLPHLFARKFSEKHWDVVEKIGNFTRQPR